MQYRSVGKSGPGRRCVRDSDEAHMRGAQTWIIVRLTYKLILIQVEVVVHMQIKFTKLLIHLRRVAGVQMHHLDELQ